MKRKKTSTRRNILIGLAAAVIVGILAGVYFYHETHYVPYTEFLEQVQNGQVARVVISGDELEYRLQDSAAPYYTENPETDEFKESILLLGIPVTKGLSGEDWESILMILIIVIMLLVMVRFFASNNGESDHYDASAKTGVTFDDIIGLDDIKKELEITIDILKNTEKYKEKGVRIPKGIVLEGEPGNGKTLLAKAIAGEAGLNFISANAADFGGIIVGKGSNQVKKLFREGRKNKPCIIFIDEFDSVAEKRKTDGTAASTDDSKTLTAFLNELDGFKNNNEGIFLIVATNRPEVIDSAMIRPGRFDKRYYVANPSFDERCGLIALYTKNKTLAPEVDVQKLAWEFTGFSCAAIEMLLNEAAILSVNRQKAAIDKADIDDSVSKYMMRGGAATAKLTKEKKQIVAVHEAGHAVTGYLLAGEKINKISILPTKSGMGGYTMTYDEDEMYLPTMEELENKVKMLYAGRAAEYIYCGGAEKQVTAGASGDIIEATKYIRQLTALGRSSALLDDGQFGDCGLDSSMEASKAAAGRLWEETVTYLRAHWREVVKVSDYLLAHETMNREEFETLLQETE